MGLVLKRRMNKRIIMNKGKPNIIWIIFCLILSSAFLWRGFFLQIEGLRIIDFTFGILLFYYGLNEYNKIANCEEKEK